MISSMSLTDQTEYNPDPEPNIGKPGFEDIKVVDIVVQK